jgi:type 1 glutamine amidotransferase
VAQVINGRFVKSPLNTSCDYDQEVIEGDEGVICGAKEYALAS